MPLIATCHCGATKIELPGPPAEGTECNCTFCRRAGAVWAYYNPGELRFISREQERLYSTNPEVHQHYFCGKCGTQTWGESPDWASLYNNDGTPKSGDATAIPTAHKLSLNLKLIGELDLATIDIVKVDGRNSW